MSDLQDREPVVPCEKCGSEKVTVTQHRSRATDDREVRGELQQVEIIECWEVRKCSECGHSRAISF